MKLRFYRDPDTGLPHLRRHGVTEDEGEGVLLSPGEDRLGRDGARVATGQSRSERYLRVTYVADAEAEGTFVITAYELTGKPLPACRRRRRRGKEKR